MFLCTRVKARFSNAAIDLVPENDPASDPDFRALGALFATDPIVALDDRGWFVSSSRFDVADQLQQPGALRDELDTVINLLNGIAIFLRTRASIAVSPSYEFEGLLFNGNSARIYKISLSASTADELDSQSDLGCYEKPFQKTPGVRVWVESLDASYANAFVSFENPVNDPRLGDNRLHALLNYRSQTNSVGVVPPSMDSTRAIEYVEAVVIRWLEHQHGLHLRGQ